MITLIRPGDLAMDAAELLLIQREAVRGGAIHHYPEDLIREWAPLPLSADAVAGFVRARGDVERIYVARSETRILGWAEWWPHSEELRNLYVRPSAAGQGIGVHLLNHVIAAAVASGAPRIRVGSALNAVGFYTKNGFRFMARDKYRLQTGREIDIERLELDLNTRRALPNDKQNLP